MDFQKHILSGAPHGSETGSETGTYLRLMDSCITQLEAHGLSRTCDESQEEKEEVHFTHDSVQGSKILSLCAIQRLKRPKIRASAIFWKSSSLPLPLFPFFSSLCIALFASPSLSRSWSLSLSLSLPAPPARPTPLSPSLPHSFSLLGATVPGRKRARHRYGARSHRTAQTGVGCWGWDFTFQFSVLGFGFRFRFRVLGFVL